MNTTRQILPGVKAIYQLECNHLLENVALRGICKMSVPVLTALNEVEIFDNAECECQTERSDSASIDTATLKFQCEKYLPSHLHLGFVVVDVNGDSYLIGAKEPPFPIVKVQRKCGTPGDDSSCYRYEVSHTAVKSLIPCTISV